VLPALGYSEGQLADLAATVARVPCDLVLAASPVDQAPLIATGKRVLRVRYEVSAGEELGRIVLGALRRMGVPVAAEPAA
jgi:predicted GTPase